VLLIEDVQRRFQKRRTNKTQKQNKTPSVPKALDEAMGCKFTPEKVESTTSRKCRGEREEAAARDYMWATCRGKGVESKQRRRRRRGGNTENSKTTQNE